VKIFKQSHAFPFRTNLIILSGIGLFALVIGTVMIQAQNPAADILGTLPVMIALDEDEDGELSFAEIDQRGNRRHSLGAAIYGLYGGTLNFPSYSPSILNRWNRFGGAGFPGTLKKKANYGTFCGFVVGHG